MANKKEWRRNEFKYSQAMMQRQQAEEKLDLYKRYFDVLSFAEKIELRKIEKKQKTFLMMGKAEKLK